MALIVDGIAYNQERDIPEIFRQGKVRLSGPIEPGNVHSYEADGDVSLNDLPKYVGSGSKCLFVTGELATFNSTKREWSMVG